MLSSIKNIRKVHYAWIVLVAVMMINAVSSGLRLSFGVYIDPLVQHYGWSRGAISFAYTLQFLTAIPVVLAAGWFESHIGTRRFVLIGGLIATAGVLLTATTTHLWQFQVYYGIISGGVGTSIFIAVLPVYVSRWFYRRLGLALGLMWTSLSWGPAVMGPLMRWSIQTFGWRQSFLVVGLVGGAIMLVGSLLLRDKPEDVGLTPYGGVPPVGDGKAPAAAKSGAAAIMTMGPVLATASFWILVFIHAAGCVGHSVPLAHMVSMATFTGIPDLKAAGMLTVTSVTSLLSRFSMSLMAERLGARWTLALALFSQTVPLFLLIGAHDLWVFYTFAAIFGIGFGGEMVGFPIFNRQYYGYYAPLSRIYSYQMVGALIGMAIGDWLGGALFDRTGSYTSAILVAATAGGLGTLASLLLPSIIKKPRKGELAAVQGVTESSTGPS